MNRCGEGQNQWKWGGGRLWGRKWGTSILKTSSIIPIGFLVIEVGRIQSSPVVKAIWKSVVNIKLVPHTTNISLWAVLYVEIIGAPHGTIKAAQWLICIFMRGVSNPYKLSEDSEKADMFTPVNTNGFHYYPPIICALHMLPYLTGLYPVLLPPSSRAKLLLTQADLNTVNTRDISRLLNVYHCMVITFIVTRYGRLCLTFSFCACRTSEAQTFISTTLSFGHCLQNWEYNDNNELGLRLSSFADRTKQVVLFKAFPPSHCLCLTD